MRYRKLYSFWLILATGVSLVACNRDNPSEDLPGIHFRAAAVETKGLLDKADLNTAGTQVRIYDYLTNYSGTIGGTEYTTSSIIPYIDGKLLTCQSDGSWIFNTEPAYYRWTRTGKHRFFGWLYADAKNSTSTSSLFGDLTCGSGYLLTIPQTKITKDSPQTDFLYSNVVLRDSQQSSGYKDEVKLDLQHLFTALAFSFDNPSDVPISDISVTLEGLKTEKSASISFSGGSAPGSYDAACTITPKESDEGLDPITLASLAAGKKWDLLAAREWETGKDQYMIMWPQTKAEYANLKVRVYCKYNGTDVVEGTLDLKDYLPDTNEELKAGTKYNICVSVSPKGLYIKVTITDWEDMQPFSFSSKASASAAKGEDTYKRWDKDGNNVSWQDQYILISDGYFQNDGVSYLSESATPGVNNSPARSRRFVVSSNTIGVTLLLHLDNTLFHFVTYDENTGQYDHAHGQIVTIPAGERTTHFYVVPNEKYSYTLSEEARSCHVYVTTAGAGVASIKIAQFAYNLPGGTQDASEINFFYTVADDYDNNRVTLNGSQIGHVDTITN